MALSGAIMVGQIFHHTFYTIKYQSQRSDCRTYVRERKIFYQFNNYSGKVKELFIIFIHKDQIMSVEHV